jgi:hypothetical protein
MAAPLSAIATLCSTAWLLAACQTAPTAPLPAHLVADKTNAACIAQMQMAASRPDGNTVVLTPAAFATEDRLSIVIADPLDGAGVPRSGRIRGVPDIFRLSLHHGRCVMTREQDGKSTLLDACTCVAMQ